jgi:hypothetical protein
LKFPDLLDLPVNPSPMTNATELPSREDSRAIEQRPFSADRSDEAPSHFS